MPLDITTKTTAHEVKASFTCPYCGRQVTAAREVAYPPKAVGVFSPVYKCLCRKFVGAPKDR